MVQCIERSGPNIIKIIVINKEKLKQSEKKKLNIIYFQFFSYRTKKTPKTNLGHVTP